MGSSTKPEKRRRDDNDGDANGGYDFEDTPAERKAKKPRRSGGDKKKDKLGKGKPGKKPIATREEPSALPALDADEAGEQAQNQDDESTSKTTVTDTSKEKKKKTKKAKKPADGAAAKDETGKTAATAAAEGDNNAGASSTNDGEDKANSGGSGKKSRFIVFVGNLPYSATVPEIQAHFASLQPTSVRLLHERTNPSKSRGIAFVEFAGYDHMKTCLRTMHHSTFAGTATDARTGRSRPDERKINVELTAGGGGNTTARKDKIRAKNVKLNEQRGRRIEAEEKAKFERRGNNNARNGGAGQQEQEQGADGIHPSRRGRVHG